MALLTTKASVLEAQFKGTGKGRRVVLDAGDNTAIKIGEIPDSWGEATREFAIDPVTRKYVPLPARRAAPEAIATTLSFRMRSVGFWERQHLNEDSRLALYLRFTDDVGDPTRKYRVHALTDVIIGKVTYPGGGEDGENEEEFVRVTMDINAADNVVITPVAASALAHGLSAADDCGAVAVAQDRDGKLYIATKADGVGGSPFIVTYDPDEETWAETEDTGLSADIADIAVAGDYVFWISGTTITRASRSDLSTTTTYTASAALSAIIAVDSATLLAVGASGLALKSDDGGLSWSTLTTGTSETLGTIFKKSIAVWYVGGTNGTLLKYQRGTFTTVATPSALAAATITGITAPEYREGTLREDDLYIGADNGKVYRVVEDGAVAAGDWSEVTHPNNASGSINDVRFIDPLGQTLFVTHAATSGASTVYRDWSGGAGGANNMEPVITTTSPANGGIAQVLPIDSNWAFAVGEDGSGNLLVVEVVAHG